MVVRRCVWVYGRVSRHYVVVLYAHQQQTLPIITILGFMENSHNMLYCKIFSTEALSALRDTQCAAQRMSKPPPTNWKGASPYPQLEGGHTEVWVWV